METTLSDAFRAIVKEENSLLLNKIETVLQNSKVIENNEKPMTFEEARNYLACSKSYLYKLTHLREVPHAKRGKRLVFDKKSLDDWLLENKVKTVSEIQEEADSYLNSINKKSKF